jgi:hypothetical protein
VSYWVWLVVLAVWLVAAAAVLAVSEMRAERRQR